MITIPTPSTPHLVDPASQTRCSLCGGLFLVDNGSAALSEHDALQLRMRPGVLVCHGSWIGKILADEDGRPAVFTGHA